MERNRSHNNTMPGNLQNGVSSTGDCKSIVSWTPLDDHSPAVGTGGVSPVRPLWIARSPPLRTSKRPRRFHAYEAHSRWAALRIGQPIGDDPKTVPTMMSCVTPLQGSTPRVWGNFDLSNHRMDAHKDQPHKCGETPVHGHTGQSNRGINPTSVGKLFHVVQ